MPSREAALLDRVESHAAWGFAISVASAATGALLLAISSSIAAERLGFIAVFSGPLAAWSFSRYRALVREARACLLEPPRDFLFERRYRLSRGQSWRAKLWTPDSPDLPIANLSWVQWSTRMYMTTERVPAKVYGAPTRHAVVVVSCPNGVVVGRVGSSTFGSDAVAADPPRGLGWLFKPRRLPFSRG